ALLAPWRLGVRREPIERALELGAQLPGGVALPVVEADAVAKAEAGQEVVAVQRNRGRERLHRPRPVSGRADERPEAGDVHRIGLDLEAHGGPADGDPAA